MHCRGSDVMSMHLVLPPRVKRPNALVATTASEAQPSLTVRRILVLRQRVMCIPLCDKPCHSQAFAGGQAEAQGQTRDSRARTSIDSTTRASGWVRPEASVLHVHTIMLRVYAVRRARPSLTVGSGRKDLKEAALSAPRRTEIT